MKLLLLLGMLPLYSSSNITQQIQSSHDERQVTVKMMQDRLKVIERRVESINECAADRFMHSEEFLDEIERLKHDKRSLLFIIKTMQEN